VTRATNAYFDEQDTLQQWIGDRCETGRTMADAHASLFASWRAYALQGGEDPGTSKRFTAAMRRLGYQSIRDDHGIRGRGFLGLKAMFGLESAA
jgi:phage/plasmid-associated DNA primase